MSKLCVVLIHKEVDVANGGYVVELTDDPIGEVRQRYMDRDGCILSQFRIWKALPDMKVGAYVKMEDVPQAAQQVMDTSKLEYGVILVSGVLTLDVYAKEGAVIDQDALEEWVKKTGGTKGFCLNWPTSTVLNKVAAFEVRERYISVMFNPWNVERVHLPKP